eukprot:9289734-Pyramimonas_sp.AAC.1
MPSECLSPRESDSVAALHHDVEALGRDRRVDADHVVSEASRSNPLLQSLKSLGGSNQLRRSDREDPR